jgi:hypothetical protein
VGHGTRAWQSSGVIEVAPLGKWFQGRLPDDTSQAAGELRERIERVYPKDGPVPFLYLAADARQSVHDISLLVSNLPQLRLILLARAESGPTGSTPPGAKDLAMRLEKVQNISERASVFGKELGRRAGPCPLLSRRLAELNDLPIEQKAQMLVSGLEEGLRGCRCGWVDIDALEYLLMRLLNYNDLDYFAVPIPWDTKGKLVIPMDPALTVQLWLQNLVASDHAMLTSTSSSTMLN